jgi:hypothetical protein
MMSHAIVLAWLALGLGPAHPFGRASMNQSLFVQVAGDELRATLELDVAETLTAEMVAGLDTDKDGEVSALETRAWSSALAEHLADQVLCTVSPKSGRLSYALALGRSATDQPKLRFEPGEDALPTLLLEFVFRGSLGLHAGEWAQVEVCNQAFARLPGLQTTEVLSAATVSSVRPGRAGSPPSGAEAAEPKASELARCVSFRVEGVGSTSGDRAGLAERAFAWVSVLAGLALILWGFRALFGGAGPGATRGKAWRQRGLGVFVIIVGVFVALQALQQLGLLRIL